MSALADRIRRRGHDPGSFLAWSLGLSSGPLDGIGDADLDVLVDQYRAVVGHPATRQPATLTPDLARRLVVEALADSILGSRRP
jgi:hypothetical protein